MEEGDSNQAYQDGEAVCADDAHSIPEEDTEGEAWAVPDRCTHHTQEYHRRYSAE